MKQKKLLLSILTMLLPVMASADSILKDGIFYSISTGDDPEAEVVAIPEGAQENFNYSGHIVIPESFIYEDWENGMKEYKVTSIAENAFKDQDYLYSITIPASVGSIGPKAFYGCSRLESVVSLRKFPIVLNTDVFSGLPANATLYVAEGYKNAYRQTTGWSSFGDHITEIDNSTLVAEKNWTGGFTGEYPFYLSCYGEVQDPISSDPDGVAITISEKSDDIRNPQTVVMDEVNLYEGHSYLVRVTAKIPSDGQLLVNLGSFLWNWDRDIPVTGSDDFQTFEIMFPNFGITCHAPFLGHVALGTGFLAGTTIVKSIEIHDLGDSEVFEVDGIYYNRTNRSTVSVTHGPQKYDGDVVIPSQVTYQGNTYDVTSIGSFAFLSNDELTSVAIPSSVTSIGASAFYCCYDLASITFPDQLTSIGGMAFLACGNLTSLSIPGSVTEIQSDAFLDCSGLTSITVEEGNTVYDSRDNCNAIIETSSNTLLCSCRNTVIPNTVTMIGAGAFRNCAGITSMTIPSSVTEIGSGAFSNCPDLTSVTIPNSVTDIGPSAFYYCSQLKSVVSEITEPYDIYNVFDYIAEDATLYVPAGTMSKYQDAEGWNSIANIVEGSSGVTLSKTKATIEKGKTLTLTATIVPAALADQGVTWKSSAPSVATVSTKGKVTGVKAGTATITCTANATGQKATCKVTVGYVKLDQTEANLQKGKTLTLKATVYPSKLTDKSVTWKSSKTSVATVSADGVVTGKKSGTATITCTSNVTGLKATCTVTVGEVKLDQTEVILEKYSTITLTPTVYPDALTDKSVTWKSSNTKIAKVTSDGEVIAMKAGTATITCTSNATGLKGTCKVTVGYVKLDKTEAVVEKGSTVALTATVYPSSLSDRSVTWESSDTKIATVTSKGKVSGVKAGIVTITCTSKATGQKATCTVTVGYVKLDKTEVTVEKGKTLTLTPTVYPSKLTDKSVTWKSSNTSVATVTSAGKVKGVKAGTTFITCTSVATGLSTTCLVTVGYVKLDQTKVSVAKGKTVTLTAKVYPSKVNQSVTWTSSDKTVATVTSAGKVKGVSAGTATITCTSEVTGLSTTCTVTVTGSSTTRSLEGDDDETTGVKAIDEAPDTAPFDVYDLSGRKVRHQVTSLNGLPKGIYIVNGKKVMIK